MLYVMGGCFRCDRGAIQVTRIGELVGSGAVTPIYACRGCVERLAAMHERAHEDPVRRYATALTP